MCAFLSSRAKMLNSIFFLALHALPRPHMALGTVLMLHTYSFLTQIASNLSSFSAVLPLTCRQSLHRLLCRWCSQKLPPPQTLHLLLSRWCSQRLMPPQSLHVLEQVQRLRRQQYLRAPEGEEQMQRLQWQRPLQAPEAEKQVQRLRWWQHLRAPAAELL